MKTLGSHDPAWVNLRTLPEWRALVKEAKHRDLVHTRRFLWFKQYLVKREHLAELCAAIQYAQPNWIAVLDTPDNRERIARAIIKDPAVVYSIGWANEMFAVAPETNVATDGDKPGNTPTVVMVDYLKTVPEPEVTVPCEHPDPNQSMELFGSLWTQGSLVTVSPISEDTKWVAIRDLAADIGCPLADVQGSVMLNVALQHRRIKPFPSLMITTDAAAALGYSTDRVPIYGVTDNTAVCVHTPYVTIKDVAQASGLTYDVVQKMVHSGQIPSLLSGKRRRIPVRYVTYPRLVQCLHHRTLSGDAILTKEEAAQQFPTVELRPQDNLVGCDDIYVRAPLARRHSQQAYEE